MVTRTKKIFVGGLSAPTTLEDVKNYFEQFGPVSSKIIIFTMSIMINEIKYKRCTVISTELFSYTIYDIVRLQ